MFPFRLDHKTEKKVCWFQCQEHMDKYIQRHKLTTKDYTVSCKRGFGIIPIAKPKPKTTRKPKATVKPKVTKKPKTTTKAKPKPKATTTAKPKPKPKPKAKTTTKTKTKVVTKNIKLLHPQVK